MTERERKNLFLFSQVFLKSSSRLIAIKFSKKNSDLGYLDSPPNAVTEGDANFQLNNMKNISEVWVLLEKVV